MPVRQLTDSQYADLAAKAGLNAPPHELQRIHHLLVNDHTIDQLMPHEQEIAKCFDGLTLTTTPSINNQAYGLPLLAVKTDKIRERGEPKTPREKVGRILKERHAEAFPETDPLFYHQIQNGFPSEWLKERQRLASEAEAAIIIETEAARLFEVEQRGKLANLRTAIFRHKSALDELPPEERNLKAEVEQESRWAKSQAKFSRGWEQADENERRLHRMNAENAWFEGKLS